MRTICCTDQYVDRRRATQQSVEKRRGDYGVVKDLAPPPKALLVGEQDVAARFTSPFEREEEICALSINRDVADLVDDEARELREDLEALLLHGHLLKCEGKSWRLKEVAARIAKQSKGP